VVGSVAGRLSVRQVQTLGPGMHADGDGLYLQVTPTGARSWILRYQLHKRRREMGLGGFPLFGLADARQRAVDARKLLSDGIDPLERRQAETVAHGVTWGDCVDALIDSLRPGWKDERQSDQWKASLRDHGPDRAMPVRKVSTDVALSCMTPIWASKTETATRVRGRSERVWDYAKVKGLVTGDNPFRWRGHLDKLLPKPSKVSKPKHHAAMPYADVPAFMARLRTGESRSRKALEFAILTAARTGEVTGATWDEFAGDVWTIPADRMKGGRIHVVPLVPRAVELLASMPRDKPPFALSENAMLYLLQRKPPKGMGLPYTVHGFRSSFSDWAHESTQHPNHVIEMALAHTIPNKAEAAYRRGSLLAKRRELMQAWADSLADRL
jgi:integrase